MLRSGHGAVKSAGATFFELESRFRKGADRHMKRWISFVTTSAIVALVVAATQESTRAQNGRGEHWVGTWATAVVVRPQGPAAAPQGFGAGLQPQCFGQAPAAPPAGEASAPPA